MIHEQELGQANVDWIDRAKARAEFKDFSSTETKGGAGSGQNAGHGFEGNQWVKVGGMAQPEHASIHLSPEDLGKLGTKVLLVKRAEAEKVGTHEDNRDELARELKTHIQDTIARETGLSRERVDAFTRTWARSSTDTIADSVAMQEAVASKFGLPMGDYLKERADYLAGGYHKDLLTVSQINEIGRNVKQFVFEANQQLSGNQSEVGQILPPPPSYGESASHQFYVAIGKQDAMLKPLELHNAALEAAVQNGEEFKSFDIVARAAENAGKDIAEIDPDVISPYKATFENYEENGVAFRNNALNLYTDEGDRQEFGARVADALRYADEVYRETQFTLKTWGVKYLALDRGMSLMEKPPSDRTKIEFESNPLSSWSADARIALRFSYHDVTSDEKSPSPWWLKATVPAEKIFSLPFTGPGCYHENEVVCIKGDYDVTAQEGPVPS
jgi:hypothetical protein